MSDFNSVPEVCANGTLFGHKWI